MIGTAEWKVNGFDIDFKHLVSKPVNVSYAGQSISLNLVKNATANQYNLVYTGNEDIKDNGLTYYEVEPKSTFDGTVIWITIGNAITIRVQSYE